MHPEAQRRSPLFPDDRQFGQHRHPSQEEFYRRRPSPHHSVTSFEDDRRLSPLHDDGGGGGRRRGGGGGEGNGERRRGGFRELFQRYENRARLPQSPPRVAREKLPPTPRTHPDHNHHHHHHQQREPGVGWRREEQGRGRGRFRDLSPSVRLDDQRGGAGRERGRRPAQGPNRDRRREDSLQERSPTFKRQRREMDDAAHLGFRDEEDFGAQRYSGLGPRDKSGAPGPLPRGAARHSGPPLVVEHGHGIAGGREPARWEQFSDRRDPDPDFDRQRSPPARPASSSQERFRAPDDREDARGRHFQDARRDSGYHEAKRNPAPLDRPNPARYGGRGGPAAHRGRGGPPHSARGRSYRGQAGRTGPLRTQPRSQQQSSYREPPREEQRAAYRPFRGDAYEDTPDGEPDWAEEDEEMEEEEEEDRLQQWEPRGPTSLERHLQRSELNPKTPRQRERGWSEQKANNNNAAATEETLTIKVDMSRPVKNNSALCYSSDRQLSLDLVNVGRQRLDFLPMLQHSGTYREPPTHTGPFAQEIISLVHLVKEQYFRGGGVSLSQRFSTPQEVYEDETEELTLDERFSANRGFSLNISSLLEDEEPLFSRLGPLQPVRGPGDLRHDLERRRQERLEGVKVTISGSGVSQRPLGPSSEPGLEYSDQDEASTMEDDGFTGWPVEPIRRREAGPRRGAPYVQRRNTRPVQRLGPMRRPNNRSNAAGPNW
ncbi:BCLAF1 and THRAP3 family member 3 isoform X2 [Clinocottus analis]